MTQQPWGDHKFHILGREICLQKKGWPRNRSQPYSIVDFYVYFKTAVLIVLLAFFVTILVK